MIRKIKKNLIKLTQSLDRRLYKNKEFVIISNNCWGAEIYKTLGVPYNTPFVGLFIFGPDYLRLLENIDYYLDLKLNFKQESKWLEGSIQYPIGVLDDIEIHFMHYKDESEAKSKWDRRLARMNKVTDKNKYFFKICDRDLTDANIISKFHNLSLKNKISFGITESNDKNHIQIKENENNQNVPDGVKLYRYSFKYIDVLEWVNSGRITNNIYSKIKSVANII